jgi:catechol 2,3-dioxygenase
MPTSNGAEPNLDTAHLAHIELLTPDPEGSVRFFTELLGMQETARKGRSVYLRAYEENYHHSLKLTEGVRAGLGHISWRARSAAALERRANAIEATGLGRGWIDGDEGHGRAYQFDTPAGHRCEIFWDVDYANCPPGETTALRTRLSKRPAQGVPVRRLDHFNITAPDVGKVRDCLVSALGFNERENILDDGSGATVASFLSVTNLSHDMAIVPEGGPAGRLHHICYFNGSNDHLFDFADLCREAGLRVEHGPGRHGVGGATFVYVMEPGGNRVEMTGDSGLTIFDPAWKTVSWKASEFLGPAGAWVGSPLPPSFLSYATPDEALTLLDAAIA